MEEKPKTRPGKNGGTLKNDAGPGRPKGPQLATLIKRLLYANNNKVAKELAASLIMQAKRGNQQAIKQLWDRIDGPITEKIENSGVTKIIIERVQVEASGATCGPNGDSESEEEI